MLKKMDLTMGILKNFEGKAVDRSTAKEIVDFTFQEIETELQHDGKCAISNFGVFSTREYAARDGRNPKTGEQVHIPAKKTVKFSASKALRNLINSEK